MKTNKRLLLGVCAGLLVGAAALTTASALAPDAPHSDLLLANAEALSSNEGGSSTEWTCWSSFTAKKDAGPSWLCGNPCEKVSDVVPSGGKGKCKAK